MRVLGDGGEGGGGGGGGGCARVRNRGGGRGEEGLKGGDASVDGFSPAAFDEFL